MKSSRILSLLLAIVMVLSLLSGCGSTAAAEAEPTAAAEAEPTAAESTAEAAEPAVTETVEPQQEPSDPDDVTAADEDAEAGALLFDPTVTPQDTQQVMILSGSWYDMGVQYGQQAEYALQRQYVQSAAEMLANCYGDKDEVYAAINAYMDQVKTECPDLYDFVLGVDESLEEYDFVQSAIATVCCLAYVNGAASNELNCMNASAWGSATESGHLLAATNGDTGLADAFQFAGTMILIPENGYVTLCSSGAGSNAYMNDQGVITLGSGGQGNLETDGFTTLISTWAQVYTTTQCATADEVLEWDQRSDMFHAWLGNTHIADTSGAAYVFENTAGHSAVRKSGDFGETDYLIANNHYLTEEMQSSLYNDGSYDDCPVRYATVEQIFRENFGSLNIGWMNEAIGSRRYYLDGQWSEENWSLDLDTFFSSDSSNTGYKTTIRCLMDANDLIFYRQMGSSDYFNNHNPDAACQFFKLTLASSASDIYMNAEYDASLLIYQAGMELDQEEEPDDALVDHLNEAKQQYLEGMAYAVQAGYYEASGDINAANLMYSKAISSHCLAQRSAQNALVSGSTYVAIEGESHTH